MSHFTVLVVTDREPTDTSLEAILLPFHEFECTGIEAYIQEIDRTEEAKQEFAETETDDDFTTFARGYYGYETVSPNEQPDIEGRHRYGYVRVDEVGGAIQVIKRTNPRKQWDWWTVGGRWQGMLFNELGRECNSCRIGALNHEAMKAQRLQNRLQQWAQYQRELAKDTKAETAAWISGVTPDMDETTYLNTDSGFSTFAFLKDGQWLQRGRMGWWGMVGDDKEDAWRGEFGDLMGALGADQWITVVDCHI